MAAIATTRIPAITRPTRAYLRLADFFVIVIKLS
jgi:hypothetical protein